MPKAHTKWINKIDSTTRVRDKYTLLYKYFDKYNRKYYFLNALHKTVLLLKFYAYDYADIKSNSFYTNKGHSQIHFFTDTGSGAYNDMVPSSVNDSVALYEACFFK